VALSIDATGRITAVRVRDAMAPALASCIMASGGGWRRSDPARPSRPTARSRSSAASSGHRTGVALRVALPSFT
jgi:hypothetical protein